MPPTAAGLRIFTVLPVTACVVLLTVAGLAPAVVRQGGVPVAAAGLLIGLPHGAVDHLVPRWAGIPASVLTTGALLGSYVAVAGVAALALILLPTAALLGFLVISAAHFGSAEMTFAAERRGDGTVAPWHDPLASASHGAVVVGLLLWARPADVVPALRLIDPQTAQLVSAARTPGLCLLAGLAVGQLARLVFLTRSRNRGDGLREAGELLLLIAAFTTAPLAAFGVYFGCWHAFRHTGRLLDAARRPVEDGWNPALRRLAAASVLPTAAALLAIGGLLAARAMAPGAGPLLVQVAVLLALTLPHTTTVWAVDSWRNLRALGSGDGEGSSAPAGRRGPRRRRRAPAGPDLQPGAGALAAGGHHQARPGPVRPGRAPRHHAGAG